jgi:hypothetical protein
MQQPENYPHNQRGSTRQKRREIEIEALVVSWMAGVDDPRSSEGRKSVRETFLEFMHGPKGKKHLDGIFESWFQNRYSHWLEQEFPISREVIAKRTEQIKSTHESTEAKLKKHIDEAIETKAQIMLLDMMTPTGKALRDCTGGECRQMGGLYLQIAERVKPTQKVGKVLREADVRKLYQE